MQKFATGSNGWWWGNLYLTDINQYRPIPKLSACDVPLDSFYFKNKTNHNNDHNHNCQLATSYFVSSELALCLKTSLAATRWCSLLNWKTTKLGRIFKKSYFFSLKLIFSDIHFSCRYRLMTSGGRYRRSSLTSTSASCCCCSVWGWVTDRRTEGQTVRLVSALPSVSWVPPTDVAGAIASRGGAAGWHDGG